MAGKEILHGYPVSVGGNDYGYPGYGSDGKGGGGGGASYMPVIAKQVPQHLELYYDLANLLIDQIMNHIHLKLERNTIDGSNRDIRAEIDLCKQLIAGAIEWHPINGPLPKRGRLLWVTDGKTVWHTDAIQWWLDRPTTVTYSDNPQAQFHSGDRGEVIAWAYVDTPHVPATIPASTKLR